MSDVDEKLKKGRQRGSLHQGTLFVSAAFFLSILKLLSPRKQDSLFILNQSGPSTLVALELFKFLRFTCSRVSRVCSNRHTQPVWHRRYASDAANSFILSSYARPQFSHAILFPST